MAITRLRHFKGSVLVSIFLSIPLPLGGVGGGPVTSHAELSPYARPRWPRAAAESRARALILQRNVAGATSLFEVLEA